MEKLEESVWGVVRQENEDQGGKVHRSVVRPALVYRAETWAFKKALETIFEVAKIRKLL